MSLPCLSRDFQEPLAVFQGSVASVGRAILSTDHSLNHCTTSLFLKAAKTDAKVSNTS